MSFKVGDFVKLNYAALPCSLLHVTSMANICNMFRVFALRSSPDGFDILAENIGIFSLPGPFPSNTIWTRSAWLTLVEDEDEIAMCLLAKIGE